MQQRSNLEIIQELKDKGELKQLMQSGLFSPKVLFHIDLYFHVKAQESLDIKPYSAVRNTAYSFNVCKATVYNAIKCFK